MPALFIAALSLMTQDNPPFDPSTLRPFTERTLFLEKYQTGLYPDGKNDMPAPH